MLFNSYAFLFVYLPVVLVAFYVIGRSSTSVAALWLVASSLVFYGYWSPAYVFLLIASVAFNYCAGYYLARQRSKGRSPRVAVAVAVAIDLAVLGYYKYVDLFLSSIANWSGQSWEPLGIILPLGISFFTFTQIAFLVDVYRGQAKEYNFVHYLLFVAYFPHLIAGPVLHHAEMMPQFRNPSMYTLNWSNAAIGMSIFTLGLAKKVLVADSLASTADSVFNAAHAGSAPMLFDAWAGALAYTFQLYFDFSGYSDMAIGLSLLLNVRLPLNFDSPYRATSIIDFWRRWHITLSTFLRDYLYVPLGGNRHGRVRRYVNLMLTMLLGGLWHGANWTFVAWGGLHGVYLIANHAWRGTKERFPFLQIARGKGWSILSWALTFVCVVVGWVLFRASSFTDAGTIIAGMAGFNGISISSIGFSSILTMLPNVVVVTDGIAPIASQGGRISTTEILLGLGSAAAIAALLPNTQQLLASRRVSYDQVRCDMSLVGTRLYDSWDCNRLWMISLGTLLALCILGFHRASAFLYFQF